MNFLDEAGLSKFLEKIKGIFAEKEIFTKTKDGLVPHPGSSNVNKFLKGDGTWAIPSSGGVGDSDFSFLGNNPIQNESEDIADTWMNLGTGYATFDTKHLVDQPYREGVVLNIVSDLGVYQQWLGVKDEVIYFRILYDDYISGWIELVNRSDMELDFERYWSKVYPVGAVYISYVNTSPASLFGGTWTKINGYFLRGANNTDTGGEDTITLTSEQSGLPLHNHSLYRQYGEIGSGGYVTLNDGMSVSSSRVAENNVVSEEESDAVSAHSNMPAYQNLYVWRRTK